MKIRMHIIIILSIFLSFFYSNNAFAKESSITSNLYFLSLNSVKIDGTTQLNEGSLTSSPYGIFVVRRLGEIYLFNESLESIKFDKEYPSISVGNFQQRSFGERGLNGVKGVYFDSITNRLIVSKVIVQNQCGYFEISELYYDSKKLNFSPEKKLWRMPLCIPLPDLSMDFPSITAKDRQGQPNISQAGGKIIKTTLGKFVVSIGNFGDKWQSDFDIFTNSNRSDHYLGKIIQFNSDFTKSKILSSGHRNPQGLLYTKNKQIWSTEHGPEGGDELNLIVDGFNYGWPWRSYGHDYSDQNGLYLTRQFPITGLKYQNPNFAWTPSIAPSNLIQVKKSTAPKWAGNFLVASLKDNSLHRLVIKKSTIVLDERINLGFRIRDITEFQSKIFLLNDDGFIVKLGLESRELNEDAVNLK